MMRVGITGKIGTGKTYCSKLLEQLGVPVFYTNDVIRQLFNSNVELKTKLCIEFGRNVYDKRGVDIIINNLRTVILMNGNGEKRKKLNQIIYPFVYKEHSDFYKNNLDKPYVLTESSTIFESGMDIIMDKIILISAVKEEVMSRVLKRNNINESIYNLLNKNQLRDEFKINLSDFVVYNNSWSTPIKRQMIEVHKSILGI